MLHTVFSNSYEVLRQALLINIHSDDEKRRDAASLFRQTEVIVPGEAVADALRRFIADQDGICAGIAFKSIGQWFIRFGRPLIGKGEEGNELEFLLWNLLSSDEFVRRHPRLNNFLRGKSAVERYGFAMHVAAVFSRYTAYRLDWVLQWMGLRSEKDFAEDERSLREKKALQAHPDYEWQRALWRELGGMLEERKTAANLQAFAGIEAVLPRVREKGEGVHIFMPFTLPPLILPLLKKMAEGELSESVDVYLYLLNPSSEYWYESVPRGAGRWQVSGEEPVLAYLRRNAASTRAMVERVYAFLNAEGAVPLIGLEPETEPGDEVHFQFRQTTGQFDPVMQRLQDLKLGSVQDTDGYYVDPGERTLLRALQHAVLTLSVEAPRRVETLADGSVVVCRAPGFIREVENLIDYLQDLFLRDETLRPEDVLVVTPNIADAAGVIEAVMSSQPAQRRLPWTVIAPEASAARLAVASWEQLVRLLFSRGDAAAFEAWLELPLVLKRWRMTANDLDIIHTWLKAGGYRFGFSDDHVAELCAKDPDMRPDRDGTLMKALERLTLTYFCESSTPLVYGDITGADGTGWRDSVVENAALFKRFTVLAHRLEEKRRTLESMGRAADPQRLGEFFAALADDFLDFSEVPEARAAIASSLETAVQAVKGALGEDRLIHPEVFALSACSHVADILWPRTPQGITFAGMTDFRGLPFRVVAVLGLDRASAFPGFNRSEEFDLMNSGTARRGDRDSRQDNRNTFMDLFLAAREWFLVSYSEGYEKGKNMPPSVVVEDFLSFVAQATGEEDAARRLAVRVPVTALSPRNFAGPDEGGRPWRSADPAMLKAVENAMAAGYAAPEAVFAQGASVLQKEETVVGADVVVKYFADPDGFVLRHFGVNAEEEERASASVMERLQAPEDGLTRSLRLRRWVAAALCGTPADVLVQAAGRDPGNGAVGVRETALKSEILRAYQAAETFRRFTPEKTIPAQVASLPGDEHLLGLRFPGQTIYGSPQGAEKVAVAITYSETDRRRQVLLQCLRSAFRPHEVCPMVLISAAPIGKEDDLIVTVPDFSKSAFGGRTCAERAVPELLRIFAGLSRQATLVPSVMYGTQVKAASRLLWRGDEVRLNETDRQNFHKVLAEFLTPWKPGTEEAGAAKLPELTENLVIAAKKLP